MQFALLIYSDPDYLEEQSEQQREVVQAEYAVLAADPRGLVSAQLQPAYTATSVRVAGGRTLLTDGPFADTKEVLGGIFVIDAPGLDEAIELATRVPAIRLGGTIEIRPLVPR